MKFKEALEHFERLKAENPRLKTVEILDTSMRATVGRHGARGPVCMVGSKSYSKTPEEVEKWRSNYSFMEDFEFVGIDIEDGLNVDVVADLCDPDFPNKHPDLCGRFGWVVCSALLEHVKEPTAAAKNVAALVRPGGHLYFTGPWVWGFHPYPNDYWRISMSGVEHLFPDLEWAEWCYSSTTKNVGVKVMDRKHERNFFLTLRPEGEPPRNLGELITDRTMAYLNITAVGRRPLV